MGLLSCMAVAMAVSMGVATLSCLVLSSLHTLGTENIVQFGATIRPRLHPRFDCFVHGPMCFVAHIPQSGMMEYLEAIFRNLPIGDVGVFPSVQDARCDVFQNGRSDLTSWLIEDVGKVILGQQGVGRVGAVRVSPWFILVLARSDNDTRRASLELLRGGVDDRTNEGRQ